MTKYKKDETTIALEAISGKWMAKIISLLMKKKTLRFGEIEIDLAGISPRTLSSHLQKLADVGIVTRKVYPEVPPKVEYSLTSLGVKYEPVFKMLEELGAKFKK